MNRRRYAIAMTVVMTAALCADRPAIAAPAAQRAQTSSLAARVMERLSSRLRRAVPAARVIEVRREGTAVEPRVCPPRPVLVRPRPLSPFQFRLPPPTA